MTMSKYARKMDEVIDAMDLIVVGCANAEIGTCLATCGFRISRAKVPESQHPKEQASPMSALVMEKTPLANSMEAV
jgi:hypothetical protein